MQMINNEQPLETNVKFISTNTNEKEKASFIMLLFGHCCFWYVV